MEGASSKSSAVVEERVMKREVVLVSRPQGLPSQDNFQVQESEFIFARPPPLGFVVLKVIWLSVDPFLRESMNQDNGFTGIPPLEIGKPIVCASVSKVIASSSPNFEEGDFAVTVAMAANYILLPAGYFFLKKIDHKGASTQLSHYLGVLGFPGLTAWVGLNIVTQLHANEEVYISAAAGSVGLLAGQLAKLKGCRVVGSAGSDEKVRMLKEAYKFDDAFNYKTEKDLSSALKRCFPNGFDVYFENVGGHMLEAALQNIKRKGRIVACGMVSQYNQEFKERDGIRNLTYMIGKSLKMEGFLVGDYAYAWDEFSKEVSQLLEQGKISYHMDILGEGLDEFGKAFIGLLKGKNIGKALLLIGEE